jgi:hypothetical protein
MVDVDGKLYASRHDFQTEFVGHLDDMWGNNASHDTEINSAGGPVRK